jgi:hypothetical protein
MSIQLEQVLYKLIDLVGDSKKGIKGIIPISRSAWLSGVKAGIYPAPVKIGSRAVAWRAKDIEEWLNSLQQTWPEQTEALIN